MDRVPVTRKRREINQGENPDTYWVRLLVQFLQGLFNFMPIGDFHWEPDREKSEILITSDTPLDLKVVGHQPSIAVVGGPMQPAGIGINNLVSIDPKTGTSLYTDMWTGFLVVYTLADNDIIAKRIAHIVRVGLLSNRKLLESPGGFFTIARHPGPSMNAASPPGGLVVGDPQGLVMVQVNVPFTAQWSWTTRPTSPPRRRSLAMIEGQRRASDYPYEEMTKLEKVNISISTTPVLVRRPRSGGVVDTIEARPGVKDFQAVLVESEPESE